MLLMFDTTVVTCVLSVYLVVLGEKGERQTMWSTLCVNLSEVLEVRGSALTEEEAWILLFEIGRQLKNIPTGGCQMYLILAENIQLHRNGGLSIRFADQCSELFPDIALVKIDSVLVYTLGMTVLGCLQKYIPDGEYLDITEELHSVLTMMTSPKSTLKAMERVIDRHKFKTEDWEHSVSQCFKQMYQSVFGSISDIKIDEISEYDSANEIASEFIEQEQGLHCVPEEKRLDDQSLYTRIATSTPGENQLAKIKQNNVPCEEPQLSQEQPERDDDCTQTESNILESEISSLYARTKGPDSNLRIGNLALTSPKSMLHCKDAPILINLCTEKSDFINVSQVTVEYLDGRKLRVNMELNRISCGHLLGLAVPHFAVSVTPSTFCLTLLKDGEYVIASPTSSIHEMSQMYRTNGDLNFHVRLRFMPHDVNSIQESNILQAMYLQTRKDLLDGFISCNTEEALLLAAYSLQYEIGNISGNCSSSFSKPFRMRDFVPVTIIDRHGSSYLRTSLSCLHEKLNGMGKAHARILYLQKAAELQDFGSHLMQIWMTRKCHNSSLAWLSVGARGMKIFNSRNQNRTILHNFSWDQLKKITYKNVMVVLITKTGTKLKFYVKRQRRSKYIVRVIGETHQFHRCNDFQSADQFSYPTATSAPRPHVTLPFLHKTPSPGSVTKPKEPRKTAYPDDIKPQEALLSSPAGGSQTLLSSSGHPQITPFEPCDQVSITENPHDLGIVTTTSELILQENLTKGEVHDLHYDEHTSIASENSLRDVFDPDDVPPPIYDTIPECLYRTPERIHETEHSFTESDTAEPSELIPVSASCDETQAVPANTAIPAQMVSSVSPNSSFFKTPEPSPVIHTSQYHNDVSRRSNVLLVPVEVYVDGEDNQHSFAREDIVSRGEGDGISYLSGPDQQSDVSRSVRHSSKAQSTRDETIPEDVSFAIADFEEFKRRLSRLKSANESSSGSEASESWSGKRS